MTLALYVIASTLVVLVLSVRLREAHGEMARLRSEHDDCARAARDERAAWAQGVTVTLACLLAGLAMAQYAPPRPRARPAGPAWAAAPGKETGR